MASASNFEMALDFYVGNVSCTLDGVEVSEQELKQFGNRCPSGYTKVKILGKGGIAVVWLGVKDGV